MSDVVVLICSSAMGALELARMNGLVPPEDAAVIEVPCSGRVDEVTILRTLRQGARAVLVVGCLLGNCRFHTGNMEAHRGVDEARNVLSQIGLAPERVEMVEVASIQFAKLIGTINEMTGRAKILGPISLSEGDA